MLVSDHDEYLAATAYKAHAQRDPSMTLVHTPIEVIPKVE